jgi:hypothetical protein
MFNSVKKNMEAIHPLAEAGGFLAFFCNRRCLDWKLGKVLD